MLSFVQYLTEHSRRTERYQTGLSLWFSEAPGPVRPPGSRACSTMKPWGSQASFSTFFQSVTHRCQSPRTRPRAVDCKRTGLRPEQKRGKEGVGVWGRGKLGPLVPPPPDQHPMPTPCLRPSTHALPPDGCRGGSPWVALDYASCGAATGRSAWFGCQTGDAGSDDAGPDISIRRVAHSLRTASGHSRLSPRIAQAAS